MYARLGPSGKTLFISLAEGIRFRHGSEIFGEQVLDSQDTLPVNKVEGDFSGFLVALDLLDRPAEVMMKEIQDLGHSCGLGRGHFQR